MAAWSDWLSPVWNCYFFLDHINRWRCRTEGVETESVFQDFGISSVHQELYSVCVVTSSQARQSQGQPVMDQDTGIKHRFVPVWLFQTHNPSLCIICLMWTFIPVWEFAPRIGRFGRKSHQCCVPCSPLSCWPRWLCVPRDWSLWLFPSAEISTWFLLDAPVPAFPSWSSL